MSWEILEYINPNRTQTVAPNGIAIWSQCGSRKTNVRFLVMTIGPHIARALDWTGSEIKVRLMLGKADDLGKIGVSADAAGRFIARKQVSGNYSLRINSLSAVGRFNMDCPRVLVDKIDIVPPATQGLPKRAVFIAPPELHAQAKLARVA